MPWQSCVLVAAHWAGTQAVPVVVLPVNGVEVVVEPVKAVVVVVGLAVLVVVLGAQAPTTFSLHWLYVPTLVQAHVSAGQLLWSKYCPQGMPLLVS